MSVQRFLLEAVVGSDFFPLSGTKKVIFIYHDVSLPSATHHSPMYSTRPDVFYNQIAFIQSRFTIIPLHEMLNSDQLLPEKQYASLTFDDGFESVRSLVFPFLNERSIPFTIFLNRTAVQMNQLWLTNLALRSADLEYLKKFFASQQYDPNQQSIFLTNPVGWVLDNFRTVNIATLIDSDHKFPKIYLDENDVRYLDQHGVHIGNHSSSHPVLSQIGSALLEYEIQGNKKYLENLVNKQVDIFAIPFGKREHYNDEVINVINESHMHVLTSNPNIVSATNKGQLIPRIGLLNESIRTLRFYLNRPNLKRIDL